MAMGSLWCLGRLRDGLVRLQVVETGGNATPVARVGIERVSMKTDLIPPEQMRAVLVESAKARLTKRDRQLCLHRLLGLHGIDTHQRPPRQTQMSTLRIFIDWYAED